MVLSFPLDIDWHEYLVSQPDIFAIEIGHTYLNQSTYAYYIGDPNKPALLLDSLIHGDELGTIHMNLHIFLYILKEAKNGNEFYKYLIEANSIFTVPIINKDGYDRNMRKNLNKSGVDLNRNFGYKFGNENFGSSPDPDSVEYRGDSAFSEPETQAIQMAINIHCCAASILIPYSYDNVSVSDDFQEIYDDYQHKYGDYPIGKATDLVYQANGEAGDWMASEGILTITLEMGVGNRNKNMTEEQINEVTQFYADPMLGFVDYLPFNPILKNYRQNSNLIELIYFNQGLSEGINVTISVINGQLLNESTIPLINGREQFQLYLQVDQEASNVNITIQYMQMNFNQRILEVIEIKTVANIHAYQIVIIITFLLLVIVVIGEWKRNANSNTDNNNHQMQLENELA